MKFIYSILSEVVKHNYYENMNREFYWVGVIVNKEFQFNSNRKTESTETKRLNSYIPQYDADRRDASFDFFLPFFI